jgi:hypothetical protein
VGAGELIAHLCREIEGQQVLSSLLFLGRMKVKYASLEELLKGQVVSRELINDEQVEDTDDTNLEDDHNSRALVMYGEREISVTLSVLLGHTTSNLGTI